MNSNKQNSKVRVRTGVKAGDIKWNHGVRVRTGVKAGGFKMNHGTRVMMMVLALGIAGGCVNRPSTEGSAEPEALDSTVAREDLDKTPEPEVRAACFTCEFAANGPSFDGTTE